MRFKIVSVLWVFVVVNSCASSAEQYCQRFADCLEDPAFFERCVDTDAERMQAREALEGDDCEEYRIILENLDDCSMANAECTPEGAFEVSDGLCEDEFAAFEGFDLTVKDCSAP